MNIDCVVRVSEVYYSCVNEINCTGKNMSKEFLHELGIADANMYLCSKEVRATSKNKLYLSGFSYD